MLQFSQFKKTVAVAAATDIARLKQMIPAYPVPIKTKRSVRISKGNRPQNRIACERLHFPSLVGDFLHASHSYNPRRQGD